MELRHIRYFLEVAKVMNFSKAAENLCIAQPPLSRQIQDLENELGVKLFIRKPHALSLTPEGAAFRLHAEQILELVDYSAEQVREMKQGLQGTLYLATVEGHAPRLIANWIAGFHKLHPNVQYQLWNGNSDDVVSRVMNGLCDLAVITEPHNEERLSCISVYKEPWVAIIPSSNPLASSPGDTVSIGDLLPYDLIIPSRSSRLDEINSWFAPLGRKPVVRCRIAHFLSAYELTRQNVGITIYPAAASELADADAGKEVCIKRLVNPEVMASYILVWNSYRPLHHAAEAFLEYVRQNIPVS